MTVPSSVADIPTPALILDAAVMQSNIDGMAEFFREGDVKLRPHFKAHIRESLPTAEVLF